MRSARTVIGGLGNLMFIKAFLIGQVMEGELPDTYIQQYSRWSRWATHVRATFLEGIEPGSIKKVSLHIRRGDYLKAKEIYVDLTETGYYQKAVAEMDKYWTAHTLSGYDIQSFANSPTYLVFCKDNQGWSQDKEDREWCRNFLDTFIPGRYELVSRYSKEEDDLNQMASCKAHIGANSSFSFWGCFLGGGVSIMPKQWFTQKALDSGIQPVELLPEWTQL